MNCLSGHHQEGHLHCKEQVATQTHTGGKSKASMHLGSAVTLAKHRSCLASSRPVR